MIAYVTLKILRPDPEGDEAKVMIFYSVRVVPNSYADDHPISAILVGSTPEEIRTNLIPALKADIEARSGLTVDSVMIL